MIDAIVRRANLPNWWVCGFFLIFISSCVVGEKDILYLNDQVIALNNRVNDLQASQQAMEKKVAGDIDENSHSIRAVREGQGDLLADIDKVKTEMQALSGRVEEQRHLVTRTVERDTTDQDALRAELTDFSERLALLETRVIQLQESVGTQQEGKPGEERAPDLLPARGEASEKQTPQEEEVVSPEEQLYNATLATYREGKYAEAITGFNDFIKQYPNSDLTDNAQFWIGEAYMASKQYEKAILAYQKVIKKHPTGNKVPNAMLRQALAFYEIDDKISARLLLKRIIKSYPDSTEAKIAETKLKTMK